MATRINVTSYVPDSRAMAKKRAWSKSMKVDTVQIVDSYTIDKTLTQPELAKVKKLLINPRLEKEFSLSGGDFSFAIEIGFLPGVTDNVGKTVVEAIEGALGKKFKAGEAVYTSRVYVLAGQMTRTEVESIALTLHNPLIERGLVYKKENLKRGLPVVVPKVRIVNHEKLATVVPLLSMSDEELVRVGKEGVASIDGTRRGPLALDLASMQEIRDHFRSIGRNPTDIELESLAQTWSEHCKHTIFASEIDEIKEGLYRGYIKRATKEIRKKKGKDDFCVSVFTDNAGGITFDKDWIVTHKVETHNSPSALDPFGGAITGIVGVNRDAMGFGLGAKPVANVYGYCFGNPTDTRPLYRDKHMKEKMLSPRRILDGVVAGVNSGGNCSGIPTVHGFSYFHDRFRGKPLVFVGTVGLIPRKIGNGKSAKKSWEKSARPGDYIVVAGGRVGLDGIHGATFSSETMDSGSPATAVQIGDPITQKKMSDAIVKEARDLGLYNSITDNGAGGISCSVAEMAKECGGAKVNLEKVPLKYPGLSPWQIWISESQERMTLAVPKSKWKRLRALFDARGVEATVIGEFTKKTQCEVWWGKQRVMDMSMDFLHDGQPEKKLVTKKSAYAFTEPTKKDFDIAEYLQHIVARPTLASHEFINRQYDHEVQAGSVMKPLIGRGQVDGDTAVFRPVLSSHKGVALSSALYPTYTEIDPYNMSACAIDTAVRNLLATGVKLADIAILDNFCWSSSNDSVRLWELKESVKSLYDTSVAYGTPLISGKDSMFNDFKGYDAKGNPTHIAALPTLLVSAMGLIADARDTISPDFKVAGDSVYLIGETKRELGGSELYLHLADQEKNPMAIGGVVPQVDTKKNKTLYALYEKAVGKKLIASSVALGHGGLAYALAKSALSGMLGVSVDITRVGKNLTPLEALFSESQGRMLVSVSAKNKKAFEAIMKNSAVHLGEVGGETLAIATGGRMIAKVQIDRLLADYKKTFRDF